MADNGLFDRLAAGLPLEERRNLFEKLNSQAIISAEPLYAAYGGAVSSPEVMESEFSRLPWYYRLWYWILSFFGSRPPDKIFGDRQVSVLGSRIEERSPGLYDCQRGWLLPAFLRQMTGLKEAARFFYSALDAGVNRDKGAFFAFLGSLEMEDVHTRLLAGTDPAALAEKNPAASEEELRQMASGALDGALSLVTGEYRNAMYRSARSLYSLKELSSFLFDRVIMAFGFNPAANGETCSAPLVRELLSVLNSILFSLKDVPSMPLLESLFLFVLQERAGEPGFDTAREMRRLLAKAEEALGVIREFNRQVPLTWILRCAERNMALLPREISGGEDWFTVYREYWKQRTGSLFAEYRKERRQREIAGAFRAFLNGAELTALEHAASGSNPGGMPVKGGPALSFLSAFYSSVFMPVINGVLQPILTGGEFSRKENRAEFTGHYNSLAKLGEDINAFAGRISPSGDYGQRYAQARQDMASLPVKRRKIQIVVDEASEDARKIKGRAGDASQGIINILCGILGRDTRNRYFPLVNLAEVAGKDSRFIPAIEETITKLQRMLTLLDDTGIMETGA